MKRRLILALVLLITSAPTATAAGGERCGVMVQDASGLRVQTVTGFSVRDADPLVLPEGIDGVVAVMCGRETIVPEVGDFRVVTDLGLPFNISSGGRVIVLEISGGQLRARFLRGELTDDERAALQAAMNEAQIIAQRQPEERARP